MKNKKIYIISLLLIILFSIYANVNTVFAAPNGTGISVVINGGSSPISRTIWGEALGLASAGNIIVGTIRWVGIAILVGAIIVKGIRFVSVSPDGKAEIKKEITLLVIGAFILFALTTILGLIIKMVQNAGLQ